MARKTKAPPPREVTRRRLARWQRERRRRRITVTIGAVVIAVVIGIIVYGIYTTVIAPPRRLLSTVDGTSIIAAQYVKALNLCQLGFYFSTGDLREDPLLMLEQYELMRQGAGGLEEPIQVTDDEITEQIRLMFEPEDEPLTDEEFQELYHQVLSDWHLSNEEFRWFAEFGLLQGKLDQHLRDQVTEVGEVVPQVHVQAILVTTEEDANDVKARLDGGEDFASVAEGYGQGDGDLGWLPQRIMSLDFDRVAFELDPDTVSEPFSIDGGYYIIIKVLDKEDMAIGEGVREQLEANAFGYWLEEQREEKVERNPDLDLDAIHEWALEQIS